jgi:hypothetical protein
MTDISNNKDRTPRAEQLLKTQRNILLFCYSLFFFLLVLANEKVFMITFPSLSALFNFRSCYITISMSKHQSTNQHERLTSAGEIPLIIKLKWPVHSTCNSLKTFKGAKLFLWTPVSSNVSPSISRSFRYLVSLPPESTPYTFQI